MKRGGCLAPRRLSAFPSWIICVTLNGEGASAGGVGGTGTAPPTAAVAATSTFLDGAGGRRGARAWGLRLARIMFMASMENNSK
mmetsp:Transcript_100581/g.284921  ORF Transcript_100581/g.284921 Transcript_100581/m.284921 type:complete len:84 (+) Transcript_100581:938-1189(+)